MTVRADESGGMCTTGAPTLPWRRARWQTPAPARSTRTHGVYFGGIPDGIHAVDDMITAQVLHELAIAREAGTCLPL